MAGMNKRMHWDITITPQFMDKEIYPVLAEIRPLWKYEDICSVKLSGGCLNTMKCYHLVLDSDKTDAIVVRILNPSFEGVVSRDKEFMVLQVAHAAGSFPAIYTSFNNGFVYPYAQGRPMTLDDCTKPDSVRQFTLMLCRFHHMDVNALDLVDMKRKPVKFDTTMQTLRNFLAQIPEKANNPAMDISFQEYRKEVTNDLLDKEITYMEDILRELPLEVSLSHGDLCFGNMLLDNTTGNVTLIDYELAGFNYRYRDLAMFFCWMPLVHARGLIPKNGFTPQHRDLWLESYLNAKYECMGRSTSEITTFERELFDIEHRILEIHSYLEIALLLSTVINIKDEKNIVSIIALSMDLYFSNKRHALQLKQKYWHLKGNVSSTSY